MRPHPSREIVNLILPPLWDRQSSDGEQNRTACIPTISIVCRLRVNQYALKNFHFIFAMDASGGTCIFLYFIEPPFLPYPCPLLNGEGGKRLHCF
jgi:hypothetical protein